MFLSLILPTYNRTETLPRLLGSLIAQKFQAFEIIVVDQNTDNRVTKILADYKTRLIIRHIQCSPGLSAAKNAGLQLAKGEYVMFPDDDCWLPDTLLYNVRTLLEEKKADFICFTAQDSTGQEIVPFTKGEGWVNSRSIWRQCCAISFAAKTQILQACGGFHTQFGLGAQWPSGEDMELPIRMLGLGYRGYYTSRLFIWHPADTTLESQEQIRRVQQYAPATGRIWRIHNYPFNYVAYHLFRPLAGCVCAAAQGKKNLAICRWNAFTGRLSGWLPCATTNTWPKPITIQAKSMLSMNAATTRVNK